MPKILYAEDDQDIRELTSLTMGFFGFSVSDVEDGAAALELALKESFDIILLDVRMPRMTGYETCRALRDYGIIQDTPVVLISAKGQEAEIKTGLDAGAVEFILKPYQPNVLIETLEEVLRNHRLGVY